MLYRRLSLRASLELVTGVRAVLPNKGFYRLLLTRQAQWLGQDATASEVPPSYDELARRFVDALHEAAAALEQSAEQSHPARMTPMGVVERGRAEAERLARQEQHAALTGFMGKSGAGKRRAPVSRDGALNPLAE
jgi:hypothetical protein